MTSKWNQTTSWTQWCETFGRDIQ